MQSEIATESSQIQGSEIQEHKKPVELLGAAEVGLQARLLVGGLSNPHVVINKNSLLPIKDAGAQGIAEQVSKKYQRASLTQRRRHQQETGLTYARWRDGFNTYLDNIREDTKHSERKSFLETLGITDSVTADDFYNEYLSGKSDVVQFVNNVETSSTREQIQQHEDIIRQLGNAFGFESSKVIDHLIHGIRNVKDDIDSFTREARQQVNTDNVRSHTLLRRIEEDGKGEEEEQPPPVEPKAKEIPKKTTPAKKTVLSTKKQAKKVTPVRRIDLEEEPEPPRPVEPKEKKEAAVVQVFPAPVREEKREEKHLMTDDELAVAVQILYDDDRIDGEKQVTVLRESERTNNYARELHAMMDEYGRDFVLERAEIAVHRLQSMLQKLGLKSDKLSKSQRWYLLGIAKAQFLAKNIAQEGRATVDVYDPLLHYRIGTNSSEGQKSYRAEEAVINDMLGWEVYRQRKKSSDIFSHLDPRMSPGDKRRLQALFTRAPKDRSDTLSGSQLREIGRLVRKNIPKR